MKIVVADAMRELDRRAMDEGGIPGTVLMENAGRATFEELIARYRPVAACPAYVLCGTGNNGGDGFVAARYLHLAGARVHVAVCGSPDSIHGDAHSHYEVLRRIGVEPSVGVPKISPSSGGVVV